MTIWIRVGLVFAVLGLFFLSGWVVRGRFDAVKEDKQIIADQQAVIIRKDKENSISQGVGYEFENNLRHIDTFYNGLLTSRSNGLPALPATACGTDAASSHYQSSQSARIIEIERQEDKQAQQLLSLQKWIRRQSQ